MALIEPFNMTKSRDSCEDSKNFEIVRVHRWGEIVATLFLALLVAWIIRSVVKNEKFHWEVIGQYLFDEQVIHGLFLTLKLTAVAMTLAIVLGTILAQMRLSNNRVFVGFSWFYAWLMRGTPVLLQLVFFFNLGALYPTISLGLPFIQPFATWQTTELINGWAAAILGLGFNIAANMAEVIRGGILGVDRKQVESGISLGMKKSMINRRVVWPQALRIIIPPTGNFVIIMLLMTSLCSFIALTDLLFTVQKIGARNFFVMPMLIVAAIWYLTITSILMVGQYFLERRFGKSQWSQVHVKLEKPVNDLEPAEEAGKAAHDAQRN